MKIILSPEVEFLKDLFTALSRPSNGLLTPRCELTLEVFTDNSPPPSCVPGMETGSRPEFPLILSNVPHLGETFENRDEVFGTSMTVRIFYVH